MVKRSRTHLLLGNRQLLPLARNYPESIRAIHAAQITAGISILEEKVPSQDRFLWDSIVGNARPSDFDAESSEA